MFFSFPLTFVLNVELSPIDPYSFQCRWSTSSYLMIGHRTLELNKEYSSSLEKKQKAMFSFLFSWSSHVSKVRVLSSRIFVFQIEDMSTLHKRFGRKHHSIGSKKENRPRQQHEQQSIFLDSADESRALYFLGLTYHLKAKELLGLSNGLLNDDIRTILNKAIVYYE